jgi:hypothetical protein
MTRKLVKVTAPSVELEALSDIYIIASRTRKLYDDMLSGPTENEAFIAALLHSIEALADKAIR